MASEEQLRDSLYKLANEVNGVVGYAGDELRAIIGNTNMAVLQRRIDEARALLGEE